MNSINPKEIIKDKVEKIKNLVTEYEKITERAEAQKYEELIDAHLKQIEYEIKYEFKRTEPFKLISLKVDYEKLKKKKHFLDFPCVRCSSNEHMTYYTGTRKMQSSSQRVTLHHQRVTHQVFKIDFPVCSVCRKKIKILKISNLATLLLLIGWVGGFDVWGIYLQWLYGAGLSTDSVTPRIFLIIAGIGGLGFLVTNIIIRLLKYYPKRFLKIKATFAGYNAPMKGKNYNYIPMVKPSTSNEWIRYEDWLKSL